MKLREKAIERFSLPADALGDCRITLQGKNSAIIENHRGILDFSPSEIRLSSLGGDICIRGEMLELFAMDKDGLIVKGRIISLELG